jgi:hypothetical protein
MKSWLVGVKRFAACLGIGALFAPVAQADVAPATDAAAPSGHAVAGGLLVRLDGDQIFVSEGGRPFERLELKDSAEAEHLRALLREMESNTRAVPADIGRSVVADGAAGWHRP